MLGRGISAHGRPGGPGGDPAADLAAARRGDNVAFGRLALWCEAEGGRLALSYVRDEDAARDVWQDALIQAWERVPAFDGDERAFRGWLMTILVNRCRNWVRDDRRHAPIEPVAGGRGTGATEQPTEPLHLLLDPDKSLDQLLEDDDYRALLRAAVAAVPEPFREVLRLHACDYSYAEIAALLGVNTNTVGTRLSRARERARAYVVGVGPHPPAPSPNTGRGGAAPNTGRGGAG
jgi:RNA polymerase sigma factor (sigma-70 family)